MSALGSLRRILIVVSAALSLALIAAPHAPAAPATALVSATVVGSDGLPIEGATIDVSVLKGTTYRPLTELATDQDGSTDAALKPASYKLDVSAPSADPTSILFTAAKGGTYEFEIELESYGSISGTISDQLSGDPIPGATVDFYRQAEDGSWPADPSFSIVATDGTYATGPIPAGSYHVGARADGYRSGSYDGYGLGYPTVVVNRGAEITGIDIALTPLAQSGTISGRVVSGALETPLTGAYVFFYKQNADGSWPATSPGWGAPTRTVRTGSDGTYASGELPLGSYVVRFFTTHTGSQWWQYAPTFDTATVIELVTPGQSLTGIDGWFNRPL